MTRLRWIRSERPPRSARSSPTLPAIGSAKMAGTTGENLVEQIAAVGDYLVALETYRARREALAHGQDHAAQPCAGHRAELD